MSSQHWRRKPIKNTKLNLILQKSKAQLQTPLSIWTILSLCLGNRLFYSPEPLWILLTFLFVVRLIRLQNPRLFWQCLISTLLILGFSSIIEQLKERSYQRWLTATTVFTVSKDQVVLNGDSFKCTQAHWFGRIQVTGTFLDEAQKQAVMRKNRVVTVEGQVTQQAAVEARNLGAVNWTTVQETQDIRGQLKLNSFRLVPENKKPKVGPWRVDFIRSWVLNRIQKAFPRKTAAILAHVYLRYQDPLLATIRTDIRNAGLGVFMSATWLVWVQLITQFLRLLMRFGVRLEYKPLIEIFILFGACLLTAGQALLVIKLLEKVMKQVLPIRQNQAFWFAWGSYCWLWSPYSLGNATVYFPLFFRCVAFFPFAELSAKRQALFYQAVFVLFTLYWEQRLSFYTTAVAAISYSFFRKNGFRYLHPVLVGQLLVASTSGYQFCQRIEHFLATETAVQRFYEWQEKSTFIVKELSLPVFVMAFFLLLSVTFSTKQRVRRYLLLYILGLGYVVQGCLPWQGIVAIVDVGQGDCIVVQLPFNRKVWLIDTGGTLQYTKEAWREKIRGPEADIRELAQFLRSRGIKAIDECLITHGHQDHCGRLAAIHKNFPIKRIRFPEGAFQQAAFQAQIKTISKGRKFPKMSALKYLFHIQVGDHYKITAVAPLKKGDGGNNDSLVLKLQIKNRSFLLTGDMEMEEEAELLATGQNLQADYLKIGHHGSRSSTSTSFLATVQPKIAFISCGQNNRYQHPHKETLAALKAKKIQIMRTDQQGMLYVTWNAGQKRLSTVKTIRD